MSKRVKTSVVALIVLIAAAIGYYGLYTQPMLRYRGEFYKPAGVFVNRLLPAVFLDVADVCDEAYYCRREYDYKDRR